MIELKAIDKAFAGNPVIQEIDLSVSTGSTTVLIGQSGCGKSTLLRLMIGLLRPDRGSVLFDGVPLTPDTLQQVRRRTGYVIQEGGLFPHMTARDNVTLMAQQLRWPHSQIDQRLAELCELTKLPPGLLARYPAQISGGQRQRVALMRALMLDPGVLLLDEPLGALDPLIRADLQNDLRSIFARLGKTVVLVTHDLAEAAWLGDRIVLLDAGRVVQQGPLSELVDSPAVPFVQRFVQAQQRPLSGGPST